MPKVTIWIRKEDEDKWKAIQDKPEWLHFNLTELRVTKEWANYWYVNDPKRVHYGGKLSVPKMDKWKNDEDGNPTIVVGDTRITQDRRSEDLKYEPMEDA